MIEIKGTRHELEHVFLAIKKSNWCIFGLSNCQQYGKCFECLWNSIDWKVTDDDTIRSVLENNRE